MSSAEVAFLVYAPLKQRRKDNSFDGNDNIGAYVVVDCLRRSGIAVDFCSVDTAPRYQVVLVSMASTYDLIAYYQQVALLPHWQPGRRRHLVVAGGFGMQNPCAVRRYVDLACFGRAEGYVVEVISALLGGVTPSSPHIMHLPELHPVEAAVNSEPYPHPVDIGGGEQWQEQYGGCPNKCRFCHFTWARRALSARFSPDSPRDYTSPEITIRDIKQVVVAKVGRIRTAFDGFSERLRYAYGKRISGNDIIEAIHHVGSYGPKATVMMAYNISNFPGETQGDRDELYETLRQCSPEYRVIVVLQSTPFRPSLMTPMQHCSVALEPATSDLRARVIHDAPNLRAIHSFSNETPWSQLCTVIVERATPDTDKLFHAICFAPKLQSGTWRQRLRLVRANFDLSPYLRRYEIDEIHPAWFLAGYIPDSRRRRVSRWMEQQVSP